MIPAVTVEGALQELKAPFSKYILGTEQVSLKACGGRVLAEPVVAQMNYPPFRRSAMDGIAVAFQEGINTYTIVDTIGAGETFQGTLAKGQGIAIMTGAMIPDTADTVIVKEALVEIDANHVRVAGKVQQGQHILLEGEDVQAGEVLAATGTRLAPGHMALLASQGVQTVCVYRKPRVLLLTTGREVVDVSDAVQAGQIYNSNRYLFQGALESLEVEVAVVAHLSDAPDALESNYQRLVQLLNTNGPIDMIISTGGVSVGDFDTMPQLYEQLGARTLYRRLQMRPGAASFGGCIERDGHITWCMGLSGNPTAALNQFYILVAPILRSLSVGTESRTPWISCYLGESIDRKHPCDRYYQGSLQYEEGKCWFYPNFAMTSGGIKSIATAEGLVKVAKNSDVMKQGNLVEVLLFSK